MSHRAHRQTSPGAGTHDENESDESPTGPGSRVQLSPILGNARDVRLVVNPGASGTEGEEDGHPDSTGQEQEPPSESVDHHRAEDGRGVVGNLEDPVDEGSGFRLGDTDGDQDRVLQQQARRRTTVSFACQTARNETRAENVPSSKRLDRYRTIARKRRWR